MSPAPVRQQGGPAPTPALDAEVDQVRLTIECAALLLGRTPKTIRNRLYEHRDAFLPARYRRVGRNWRRHRMLALTELRVLRRVLSGDNKHRPQASPDGHSQGVSSL
jgi:hypothetical protein